jgi:acetoin utilization deacetylase AcuC-like enzyme
MRILLNIAEEVCEGRLVACLEGGYHIDGLTQSVKAVLNEMNGKTHHSDEEIERIAHDAIMWKTPIIQKVIDRHAPFWKFF